MKPDTTQQDTDLSSRWVMSRCIDEFHACNQALDGMAAALCAGIDAETLTGTRAYEIIYCLVTRQERLHAEMSALFDPSAHRQDLKPERLAALLDAPDSPQDTMSN